MGSVDDGRYLSNVRFMKTKFTNRLTIHLDLVVRMFAHKLFTYFGHFPISSSNGRFS
jgi:hypothetical protein